MSGLRKINDSFQLKENKVLPFTILQKKEKNEIFLCKSQQEELYGYAQDIIIINAYINEVSNIKIPIISYSEIKNYSDWSDSIIKLKTSASIWNNSVLTAIGSLPENMKLDYNSINQNFGRLDNACNDILLDLKYNMAINIESFNEYFSSLKKKVEMQNSRLKDFFKLLSDTQKRLNKENEQLKHLYNQSIQFTQSQQEQIDTLKREINNYEDSRNGVIAGASITGILAGLALIGSIIAFIAGGVGGIVIGILGICGTALIGTATGICTQEAIRLKKLIEDTTNKMDQVTKEKTAVALITNQLNSFTAQTDGLVGKVIEIQDNWNLVAKAIENINKKVQSLEKSLEKVKEASKIEEDWQAIKKDLGLLKEIMDVLNEGIQTMDVKTKIYTDTNLTDCNTAEEIQKKLKKAAEKYTKQQRTVS